ncbi:MAG: 50S ribosomal protein L28 [Candidatus Peregrinibacteria bacterium]
MAKVCQLSGKRPSTGHNVSHSVRRTKRRFLPNLQIKKVFNPKTGKVETMKVATSALRTLMKPARKKVKKHSAVLSQKGNA